MTVSTASKPLRLLLSSLCKYPLPDPSIEGAAPAKFPPPFKEVSPDEGDKIRGDGSSLAMEREIPSLSLPVRSDFAMRDRQTHAMRNETSLSINQREGDAVKVNRLGLEGLFLGRDKEFHQQTPFGGLPECT